MKDLMAGIACIEIDGWRYALDLDRGRIFPELRGGDGEEDENQPKPKTFTQDEVNALVGQARGEAKRKATQDLADELGCTFEEAKTKLATAQAAEDADKSAAQLARQQADAEKATAAEERKTAARERFEAKVERKLLRAGLGAHIADSDDDADAKRDKALVRALKAIDLASDADDSAIDAEIADLKAVIPGLFAPAKADDDEPKGPPSSLTGGKPPTQQRSGNGPSAARLAARKRNGYVEAKAS